MGVVVQNVLFPSRTDLLFFYCCHKKKSFYRFTFFILFYVCNFSTSLFLLFLQSVSKMCISWKIIFPKQLSFLWRVVFYCYSEFHFQENNSKKDFFFLLFISFFCVTKEGHSWQTTFFVLFLFKQKSLQRFWCG